MTYYIVIGICIFLLLAVIYVSAKPISMGIEARRNLNRDLKDEDNKTYVISFHEPMSQIWYSSPVSGAHHFDINVSNKESSCISTRDHNIKFPDFFFNEVSDS